jgi:hypothetical protein
VDEEVEDEVEDENVIDVETVSKTELKHVILEELELLEKIENYSQKIQKLIRIM